MFKNTFQSGFLSILYSIGYVTFLLLLTVVLSKGAAFTSLARVVAPRLALAYPARHDDIMVLGWGGNRE